MDVLGYIRPPGGYSGLLRCSGCRLGGSGIVAGLVPGVDPRAKDKAAALAGIFERARGKGSCRRSFTVTVSYVERGLFAEYATLVAKYTPGCTFDEDERAVALRTSAAVRTLTLGARPSVAASL